jgi:hypothetical protein
MHGMVLKTSDIDYSDLSEYGRVVIERTSAGVIVTVDGFEFGKSESCRMQVAKGAAWARDILATAVAATRLVPGGEIVLASGLSHGELEAEAERAERK